MPVHIGHMGARREGFLTCAFAWRSALVAFVGIADVASAQTTIAGRVIDRRTGNGVVAATVNASPGSTITDSVGRFSLVVPLGDAVQLHFRRLGYSPHDTVVDLGRPDLQQLLFALAPLPLRLDTVSVKAIGELPGVILEFEERRLRGLGRYVSREELRKQDDRVLADVLRGRMPGLGFLPVRGAILLYSPSAGCFTMIYLDGVPIYRWERGGAAKEPPDFNALFTREFDGLEYYAHPSSVPVQYRTEGAKCGVLLLWSRRR